MSPRFVLHSAAGLGALALSCGGMRLPSMPGTPDGLLQAAETTVKGLHDTSECDKLDVDVSIKEEYALGGALAINWVQQGGGLMPLEPAGNKALIRYLNIVGRNLGAQSPRPSLEWTFGVLQNGQSIDAVSAPGGYVFVTRALLQAVENEAQLAGVLAHEIAHVTSKHALARYRQVKVTQCRFSIGKKAGGELGTQTGVDLTPDGLDFLIGALGEVGSELDLDLHVDLLENLADSSVDTIVENGFGKDDEFAADELAVRLLVSAGYDPREYIEFLSKIPDSRSGFDNHPRKVDRVKRLVALLNAGKETTADFPELPSATAGLVQPPLPPEFSALRHPVARDKP
ncbi:MAG: M48 family metalloprotease [Myxococcaceae bacterium]|nr:M48 family metalloprotease [Myxococcaceae bacterium]